MRRIRVRIESAEQRIWLYQHFPDPDVSGIMTQRGWDSNLAKYTDCEMILVRGWAYMENTRDWVLLPRKQ